MINSYKESIEMYRSLSSILLLLMISLPCNASNLLREQRIAEQIQDAILQGEPVWLQAGKLRFFAIHTQTSQANSLGGVILLHGMGANPDWTDVIHPLRINLPELGWDTLSIQLPVASSDADAHDYLSLIPQAVPRIQAAIEFFSTKQKPNLILLGHSLGARMGLQFLTQTKPEEIQGFIAIGLSAGAHSTNNPVLDAIRQIDTPMLDLFGSQDLASVTQTAALRRQAARLSNGIDYRQDIIPGANHFFHGLEDTLLRRVGAWIRRVVSSRDINPPASSP